MNIRILNATEYPQVIRMVSDCFEYPEREQIDKDFPHLFAENNRQHLWVAEEGNIQGHAGAWFTRLRVENSLWPVGGVGGVCTIAAARGHGVAQKLIKAACADLKKQGAVLAFLWSGKHDYYRKLGFEAVGRQWSITIPHDGPKVISKDFQFSEEKSDAFFLESLPLLKKKPFGIERDETLHRLLLSASGCRVFAARRAEGLAAYVVVNKGRDLGDHIHEWAGESNALLELIPWLAQKIGRPHVLLTPQVSEVEAPFIYEFDRRGYPIEAGVMALAKVLAPAVLAELINKQLAGRFNVRVKAATPTDSPTYICTAEAEEFNFTEAQFLHFVFGAGGDTVAGLPLRLWWWGMESV